jgi:uncharacterized caspase-like protein
MMIKRLIFFALTLGLLTITADPSWGRDKGEFRTLAVGVTKYHGILEPRGDSPLALGTAARKMQDAFTALAHRAGYRDENISNTVLVDDGEESVHPTTANILLKLSEISRQAYKSEDTIVFYFTGHGSTSPDGEITLYSTGADGITENVDVYGIRLSSVIQRFRNSRAGTKIIFIDAPRIPTPGILGRRLSSEHFQNFMPEQNMAIFFSSNFHEVAYVDENMGIGIFTKHLIMALTKGVRDMDERIPCETDGLTASDLIKYLREKVEKETLHKYHNTQTPVVLINSNYGTFSLLNYQEDKSLDRRGTTSPNKLIEINRPQILKFEGQIPQLFKSGNLFFLNGATIEVKDIDHETKTVTYLGKEKAEASFVRKGLNAIAKEGKTVLLWNRDDRLKELKNPYGESYAIISAIDRYNESTSYEPLKGMVNRANDLIDVLLKLGFPRKNIIELFDEKATSININNVLKQFWEGGELAKQGPSRLFFYFGGHGDHFERGLGVQKHKHGYLVTYDHNPKKIAQTSILMRRFKTDHFLEIQAHHMLIALDSCSSGLAIPGFQQGGIDKKDFYDPNVYKINKDTKFKARDVLVAATHDQKAVWEREQGGGVFTKFLIEALRGKGDVDKDRLIQFDELAWWLSNNVSYNIELEEGVSQVPVGYSATNGKTIFLLPTDSK